MEIFQSYASFGASIMLRSLGHVWLRKGVPNLRASSSISPNPILSLFCFSTGRISLVASLHHATGGI